MELLACPGCGSEFFLSSHSGERSVFHLDTDHCPHGVSADLNLEERSCVDLQSIHCGACSWTGSTSELVESRM